jgi:hypothetical protein
VELWPEPALQHAHQLLVSADVGAEPVAKGRRVEVPRLDGRQLGLAALGPRRRRTGKEARLCRRMADAYPDQAASNATTASRVASRMVIQRSRAVIASPWLPSCWWCSAISLPTSEADRPPSGMANHHHGDSGGRCWAMSRRFGDIEAGGLVEALGGLAASHAVEVIAPGALSSSIANRPSWFRPAKPPLYLDEGVAGADGWLPRFVKRCVTARTARADACLSSRVGGSGRWPTSRGRSLAGVAARQ